MALVFSWNVAGRKVLQPRQANALAWRDIDLLCLQEVTRTTAPLWSKALEALGYSVALSEIPPGAARGRRLGALVAGPSPLAVVKTKGLPWPERHLCVRAQIDGLETEIHVVHAPLSDKPDRAKVLTLERVFEMATAGDRPRIIAGDLNTPQYESREGEISTFARTRSGLLRNGRDERHDRAELALLSELPARGWRDAFRSVHGYGRRDRSWAYPNRSFGYRLDHILLSPHFTAIACDYVHDLRDEGLSDHSAIWAETEAATPSRAPVP